jgi:HK97 gp10 family phage protein
VSDFDIQIDGLQELLAKMKSLPVNLARNGLRAAVNAGAEVIRKDAVSRVPVLTGRLKKAIYKKQIRELSNNVQQTFFVGARSGKKYKKANKDAYYWRFLEFGTSKMPAKPFLRPAFDAKKRQAVDAIGRKLKERIDKLAVGK